MLLPAAPLRREVWLTLRPICSVTAPNTHTTDLQLIFGGGIQHHQVLQEGAKVWDHTLRQMSGSDTPATAMRALHPSAPSRHIASEDKVKSPHPAMPSRRLLPAPLLTPTHLPPKALTPPRKPDFGDFLEFGSREGRPFTS